MEEIVHLLNRYGYSIVFINVFLETLGLPLPAGPILLVAGAIAASPQGTLNIFAVLGDAYAAMLLGDIILYLVGRYTGWALLGLICRLSANPETCILKSAESFYRRGKITILFAKYVPGINTMAAPLAGSLRMRVTQFLMLDFIAVGLYIGPFIAAGFFFSHFIERIAGAFHSIGQIVAVLGAVAIAVYIAYRFRNYWKNRMYLVVPRVSVEALASRMESIEDPSRIVLADTRSHGYYDGGAFRIKGSIRLEPNNLMVEMKKLSKEKEIYLYCT